MAPLREDGSASCHVRADGISPHSPLPRRRQHGCRAARLALGDPGVRVGIVESERRRLGCAPEGAQAAESSRVRATSSCAKDSGVRKYERIDRGLSEGPGCSCRHDRRATNGVLSDDRARVCELNSGAE